MSEVKGNDEDHETGEESNGPSIEDVRLAPFNPTSDQVQDLILGHLNLNENDVLYDLGCGDARLLINAVSRVRGLRCVGIEFDRKFSERAINKIRDTLPLDARCRIEIREGDAAALAMLPSPKKEDEGDDIGVLCKDLTLMDATAVYCFLLPKGMIKMKELLDQVVERCKSEGRTLQCAAYLFQFHGWTPTLLDRNTKSKNPVYIYRLS